MPKKATPSAAVTIPEPEKPEFFSQKVANPIPAKTPTTRKSAPAPKTRDVRKQIASIYENAEPMMSPPPKRSSKFKALLLTIFILAFLTAVSWTGFFLFGRGSGFNEDKINLTAQTNIEPLVGQEFIYQVKIKNQSRTILNTASVSLRFPQGYEFISADPVASGPDNKVWELGALDPGQETIIDIKGLIWDNTEADTNLQMILNYKPGDLSVEFQKVVIFKKILSAPGVTLTATLPTEGSSGSEIPLSLSLDNPTNLNLTNLELSLSLPTGFKINDKNWKENKLTVSSLPTASSTIISTILVPTAAINPGIQQIKIDLKNKKDNKSYLLQSITKEININKSTLSLQVAANGESEKQTVNFGDKVTFLVAYENNGNTDLKNVTMRLVLDTPSVDNKSLFDWTKIQDKLDGTVTAEQISPQVRRAIITWNKAQIPALANLKPQDKNSWEVVLPLKTKESFNLAKLTEFKTIVFSEAMLGSEATNSNLQSNNLTLILNSDLSLTSQATFKENKNLPLQIGKNEFDSKSIYNVAWSLTNSLHEITDLQITTTLPENVDWEKSASATAGEITYDETTKQITWKLNRLPTSFPKVIINFDVGLKYADQNSGKETVMLEKTRVEAKDKITEESILFWKDPITVLP